MQHYQNENQKREHASALKEDKLDLHVCFSAENFHEQDKYFRFYYILGCTFTFVFSHVKITSMSYVKGDLVHCQCLVNFSLIP